MVLITATVGRQVGADAELRLISAKDDFINQSTLTGEAMPIERVAAATPRPRRRRLTSPPSASMGSAVVSGVGYGAVLLTGPRTAFGVVASAIAAQRVLTSFDKGIARFTWLGRI